MADFGDIREILQQDPSSHTWTQLSEGLQHWYGTEPLQSVLEYCTSHLSHWPEDLPTFAPRAWFKRPAKLVAKSPITAFFTYCITGRTDHFMTEAIAQLEAYKPLKPPKFTSLEALGTLRWRTGEALDETQRKRFIKMLRENNDALGNVQLERLRQLLDDADCQRWSKTLHTHWHEAGEKSAHKWALYQIAYLGVESDIDFTTRSLVGMVSSGGHTRAAQYLEIKASFESRDAMARVADFALEAPSRYSAQSHAARLIVDASRSKSAPSNYAYINRHTSYFSPFLDELDKAKGKKIASLLEQAMIRQIQLPAWRIQQGFLADDSRKQELAGVVFGVDKKRFHVVDGAPVTLTGKVFELESSDFVHVVHPAELSDKEKRSWQVRFEDDHITPRFAQLTREVITRQAPVIPKGGVEVADAYFYQEGPFSEGPEQDNGYAYSIVCSPEGQPWTLELGVNYFIRVGYGDVEEGNTPPRVERMDIASRLYDRVEQDPVVYSEASLIVRDALDRAARAS